ncbi:FUSC family protein [Saccharopolyspora rosea]|uniref:FUSC family protein n=1 Tax=Saccharopolyspora rosea TaxID=524884 RepID=A0ABW3FTA2_9PSEU
MTAGTPFFPAWLRRMLRPASLPADWTRVCAAAVGVGAPQVVGLLTGRTEEAVLASVGALCVSFSDLTTSYRHRLRRVGLTAVLGTAGFAVGAATTGAPAAAVVVAVAVLSVLASAMGDLWAAAGAQLLTFCIVATGQRSGALSVGEHVLWFACGASLVVAMVAATWPFRRATPARRAVAAVFTEIVRMVTATGTAEATASRRELTRALNDAHDLLVDGAAVSRSRVHDRLYLVHARTTPIVEASVALVHAGIRPPNRALDALRSLARCMRTGAVPDRYDPGDDDSALVRALDRGIAELVTAFRRAKLPAASPRQRSGFRFAVGRRTWILALRMALCLAAAECVGLVAGLDRGYWVALTVALVLKPNSGSVFARTVLRGVGTVLGVLVALAILSAVPGGWWTLPFVVALAAELPVALSRHYGLFTAVVTTLVLLQTEGHGVPTARLVDSLVGCAIVLLVGFLLRPLSRGPALPVQFADAVDEVAEYVSLSLAGRHGRSAQRRRTYRRLADLRAALQQHLVDPAAARGAEHWWPTAALLERLVDAATERALATAEHDLQHAQRLVSALHATSRRLRGPSPSPTAFHDELTSVYSGLNRASSSDLAGSAGHATACRTSCSWSVASQTST